MTADRLEREIYSLICSSDGIRARNIAKAMELPRETVNHYLYSSPFMHELCYTDDDYNWHGLIQQRIPHMGIAEFSGFYDTVSGFMALSEKEWLDRLFDGCRKIGRNLNDTRGLFHSFTDARSVMRNLFSSLAADGVPCRDWEIIFELRIKRAHSIRIYADVLVLAKDRAFSLEFKMKDTIDPVEVAQAAKYEDYLNIILGKSYDVISVLVLTRAEGLYTYAPLGDTTAEIPVVSADELPQLVSDYL